MEWKGEGRGPEWPPFRVWHRALQMVNPALDTTQLNSTDLLRADWLYAATGSVALPIAGDS